MTIRNFAVSISLPLLLMFTTGDATSATSKSGTVYEPAEFNADSPRLPPGYTGLNAAGFFKAFAARAESSDSFAKISRYHALSAMKKGEYETTEAFEGRRAQISLLPIDVQKLYAFDLPDIYSEYDADKRVLVIKSGTDIRNAIYDRERRAVAVGVLHREQSKYAASNAFGAARTVNKVNSEVIYIALPLKSRLFGAYATRHDTFANSYQFELGLPSEPADAKRVKDSGLSVLVIGRVAGTKIIDARVIFTQPTIDRPSDISIFGWAIPFDAEKMIVYVKKTGEILKKIDLD